MFLTDYLGLVCIFFLQYYVYLIFEKYNSNYSFTFIIVVYFLYVIRIIRLFDYPI